MYLPLLAFTSLNLCAPAQDALILELNLYLTHLSDLRRMLTNMFQLVQPTLTPSKHPLSPQTCFHLLSMSPASWMRNRISRDFAADTRTSAQSMCKKESERLAKGIQATAISAPLPVTKTTPCKNRFAISRAESPTTEPTLVVHILSVHLLHSCLRAFPASSLSLSLCNPAY